MTTAPAEWTAHASSIAEIERELAELRRRASGEGGAPTLRTSVLTHIVWAPEEWLPAAQQTLAGLEEHHPSRTILLVPDPDSGRNEIEAEVSLRCFRISEVDRRVCSEVIQLRLGGARAKAPASLVIPLLISDLPAFCRWRGQPPFGQPELEQLVSTVDRVVVDSAEWEDLPWAYGQLVTLFDRAAVSDIAWSRGLPWRRALAQLWPDIAEARRVSVAAPLADALLLAGWLRARLGTEIELEHTPAEEIASVAVDGMPLRTPPRKLRNASDLLSEELDRFVREPVYEEATRTAA